jgi:SAM-dependent methyltransferase
MIPLLILTLILLAAFMVLLLLPALSGQPWVPANENRIHRALEMAGLKPGEVLYDLGSGDGRVLIAAARDFGARAVGVELSPLLCALALIKVLSAGVGKHVQLQCGSYFNAKPGDADVVYLYLTSGNANRLREKLGGDLKTGARVVSVSADLEGWLPAEVDREALIFLYTIPPNIN